MSPKQVPVYAALALQVAVLAFLVAEVVGHDFVEVVGVRCAEQVGDYPIGHSGGVWTDYIHFQATSKCSRDGNCLGVMRYIGSDLVHCQYWCGRPQFCNFDSLQLEPNNLWVSYLKREEYRLVVLPTWKDTQALDCTRLHPHVLSGPPVYLIEEVHPEVPGIANACRVLSRSFESPALFVEPGARPLGTHQSLAATLAGLVEEREDEALHNFAATAAVTGEPWRYFFDAHKYPELGLGIRSNKSNFLSIFFPSAGSRCLGHDGSWLSPEDVAERAPVHIGDGSEAALRAAFETYEVTLFCGEYENSQLPPLELVHALAWAAFPFVPEALHARLQTVMLHLPDAVMPYRSMHPLDTIEAVSLAFKQPEFRHKERLMFHSQTLLYYRYREEPEARLQHYACSLCEQHQRQSLRAHAKQGEIGSVSYLFCAMSTRRAASVRQVVRETWGQALRNVSGAAMRFFIGRGTKSTTPSDMLMGDVIELPVVESQRSANVKAFLMIEWALGSFPHMSWLLRYDDNVYLRPSLILSQLSHRPPIRCLWGSFELESNIQRDPAHEQYNSYKQCKEQRHPVGDDLFPPYPRDHLWAMSIDLAGLVVEWWLKAREQLGDMADLAGYLPHPDGPALGVAINQLVAAGHSINLDDRDSKMFLVNPSCSDTSTGIDWRTLVVGNINVERPPPWECLWGIDRSPPWEAQRSPESCLCPPPLEEEPA